MPPLAPGLNMLLYCRHISISVFFHVSVRSFLTGTEFKDGTGGTCPPNFETRGTYYLLSPPTFCDKKQCNCANFMVTLLLETFPQHKTRE